MSKLVMCSGELYEEPITTDQCLECALKHAGDQPCGFGYRLLKAMFQSQENRDSEIHVTDITGCLLKAYLDKKHPAPVYVHEILPLWLGIAVHSGLDISDEHVQSEIAVSGKNIIGRLDAEYEDGRIEDAKTTRWLKPDTLPHGTHGVQVNIYRALRNKDRNRLQIQYIDMSGPSKCRSCGVKMRRINGVVQCPKCGNAPRDGHLGAMLVEIPVDDEIEGFIEERVEKLSRALASENPPNPEPGFLCGYCPHIACAYNKSNGG